MVTLPFFNWKVKICNYKNVRVLFLSYSCYGEADEFKGSEEMTVGCILYGT